MKRIVILAIYDAEGIIDEYLFHYASELKKVVSKLIAVINGMVLQEYYEKLQVIASDIIVRENCGFDFGAYKAVIEKYGINFFLEQDEVILTNDTNFGPFVSFEEILKKVDARYDFWGLNYVKRDFLSYLDAYFLGFRKPVIKDAFTYLLDSDPNNMSKFDIVQVYEVGLFQYLKNKAYSYTSYTRCENTNLYQSPNYAVKNYRLPIMKKRCFEPAMYNKDNCIDCLRYIQRVYDYDIEMITETVKRKYGTVFDLDNWEKEEIKPIRKIFPSVNMTEAEILELGEMEKEIFIFGIGDYGKLIWNKFHESVEFKGFIVSDECFTIDECMGIRVYKLSEIHIEKVVILVSIKNIASLRNNILLRNENVRFLWLKEE